MNEQITIKRLVAGQLEANCYLIVSAGELLVVDPGGDADVLLREIKKTGAKVKYIVNTHYHADHISANEKIKEKTGAKILIHEAEKDFIDFIPDEFLKNNNQIRIGKHTLTIIHSPGHTKGSICLLDENFIFTGDTLFEDGCGRTDLPGGSEKEMNDSLKKVGELLKSEMTIYPGHGAPFVFKTK